MMETTENITYNHSSDDESTTTNHHQQQSSLHTIPKRHYYLTRRGKILQSTTERYLRDDLGFGTLLIPSSDSLSSSTNYKERKNKETIAGKVTELIPYTVNEIGDLYNLLLSTTTSITYDIMSNSSKKRLPIRVAIIDTNILLHHMDVLEYLRDSSLSSTDEDDSGGSGGKEGEEGKMKHYSIANAIIIPQTALEECRHRSLVMYRRATDLVRSSSSADDGDKKGGKRKKKRCVIVFADVHHVDTQISNTTSTAPSIDSDNAKENNEQEQEGGATINDENDARIRKVAYYYGKAIYNYQQQQNQQQDDNSSSPQIEVLYLSDDLNSRKLSSSDSLYYKSKSMREHVTTLQKEDTTLNLLDMVAQFNTTNNVSSAPPGFEKNGANGSNNYYYTPHIQSKTLMTGLQTQNYYQGIYRSNRDCYNEGYVTIRQNDERLAIVINGIQDINRAVDGDIVAIELYSVDKWLGSEDGRSSKDVKDIDKNTHNEANVEKKKEKKQATAGIAADTAEPSVRDTENITEEITIVNDESGMGIQELRKPTGKVVGIIRRNFHKNYCGSICTIDTTEKTKTMDDNNTDIDDDEIHPHDAIAAKHEREHPDGITSTVVFFSIDQRIPPILLRTTQRDRLVGMRILVSIDSWPADSEYPLGHYVKTLGVTGTKDTETQVLLQEFRIPCEPFPAKVLACLPSVDYKIELEPGRADLRHIPVLSIDPPGCKDIDDALHCTELPNGNWQVGVHIADVTHYVEAGTAIDLEAANRSTSTYLVNKRLDMLPSLLTTDLCSLKGNVDRFAFSVLWEVTPDAEIVDVEFKKSIIHSIAALTYQQAQALIDKPDQDCKDDIQAGAVKRLASLARKFRARRIDAGALTLASPEVKFVLDSESLNPTDVQAYTLYEANALVEEFMLLANVTVAKKILRHYPTLSILRRHPAPNRSMFDSLIQKAKTRGINICIDDSKKLADSLNEAGKQLSEDPYLDQLMRILSTRCMSPAQYFCSGEYQAKDWHHYGLAAPVYTHFTSPIRRYADVCVHRLLAAAIGVAPLPVFLSSKSHLHDLAANMNRRHRAAQLAGRASVQLHTLIFFAGGEDGEEGGGVKEEDAYVLDVETSENAEPSFRVMVPRYGIEGKVRLSNIDKECLIRDPEKHRLRYKDPNTGKVLASVAVFDKVRVKIWVKSRRDQKELVVDLLEPKIFGVSKDQKKKKKQRTK